MKLSQLTRREWLLVIVIVALALAWLHEKLQYARLQATIAHTNGSWIIAVGDLPIAEWTKVTDRQKEAYDHLHYGKRAP